MQASLLTVQEAATTSRLSVSTIRRAIRLRQLRVVRPVGRRRLLVPAPALEAFIYGVPAGRDAPPTVDHALRSSLGLSPVPGVPSERLFESDPDNRSGSAMTESSTVRDDTRAHDP